MPMITLPIKLTVAALATLTGSLFFTGAIHSDRESAVMAYRKGANDTQTRSDLRGTSKNFTLEVHKINTEIAPGVTVEQWAYAFPGQKPTVPGPELRVTEGDRVTITFTNTHDQPHTVHLHGIARLSQTEDGIDPILPGQSTSYTFVAPEPGTHAYHCHFQTYLHADMGMYGALIVEPRNAREQVWDSEETLILDEWDSTQDPRAAVHVSHPDHFLVNGKAFPMTKNVRIPPGETKLLRVINMGDEPHSWHLHGNNFLKVAKDGIDLRQPTREDVLFIAPGERADILVKGRDGTFPFHDHMVKNVTNKNVYPGGMHIMVEGGPANDPYGRPVPVAAPAHGHAAAHGDTGHDHAHDHAEPAQSAASTPQTVHIKNFAFDQPVLRIKAGTKVTWINDDAAPHSVTGGHPGGDPKARPFDSSREAAGTPVLMKQGEQWSYTFTKKGEFVYFCLPHTNMTAKVIVE